MSILDLYNNNNEMAQNTINNLAQTQTVAPKRNLTEIYNQALGKTTPAWAMALSNAMPSIGEIVANATIKNGFQQRPVAESLERQKNRQQAYNQWLQENEQNQAKDYVQMAKEQLGLDMANDEREYNRNIAQLNRDDRLNAQKQAYNQWLQEQEEKKRQQEIANKWKEIDDINKREQIEQTKLSAETDRALKQAQTDKINYENSPEYRKQTLKQQEQAIKQEQDKQRQEQLKTYVTTAKELFNKGLLSNEDLVAIEKNPELAESLVPAKKRVPLLNIPTFFDSSRRLKIDKNAKQDFQILKDANGNMAKVYKDGRIEEL